MSFIIRSQTTKTFFQSKMNVSEKEQDTLPQSSGLFYTFLIFSGFKTKVGKKQQFLLNLYQQKSNSGSVSHSQCLCKGIRGEGVYSFNLINFPIFFLLII